MSNTEKPPLACTICAKAKARCIWSSSESMSCERCERLDKICETRDRAPPRVKKRPKRSRVAELEKRLSELSSQVQAKSQAAEASQSPEVVNVPKKGPLDLTHLFPDPKEQTPTAHSPPPAKPRPLSVKPLPFPMVAHHAWETLWPMPDETEELLKQFQTAYANIFPFVRIPRSTTAAGLKESKPFLFKAVMVVACYLDGGRHHRLGEEVLWDMSKAILMDGDKSLDLLQALMLIIAWFHHALKSTRLTSLLFLARSMCLNLGMGGTQPIPNPGESVGMNLDLDLYRAYCGTYYLNTLVFTANKRTDVFMNTVYLDNCCRLLETAQQHASDEFLVKLVKIQQIAQSISMTMALEQGQQAMQLPLTIVVQSFQDQLDAFKSSLPPRLMGNPMLTSHIQLAAVLLTEIALSDEHCSPPHMPLTDRLRLLYSCVRSLRAFFETRFKPEIFNVEFPRFLCLHGSDLTYGVLMSVRLVTLKLPGWGMAKVGEELSIRWIMERLCFHISCLVEKRRKGVWGKTGVREGEDPFERVLDTCQRARAQVVLEMERAERERDGESADPANALEEPGPSIVDGLMSEDVWAAFLEEAGWSMNTDLGLLEPV